MKPKPKALIFDFDGVIHNTFDFHIEKIREFTGFNIEENDLRDIHNGNFFKNKNENLKNVDWIKYRDYIYKPFSELKIEENIRKALLDLSDNYDLFIVSSGGTKNIIDCLEENNLKNLFKEIMGADLHSRSKVDKFNSLLQKYSLNLNDCLFVTDTLGDIMEANEVGMKTIAVDFGYHAKKTLEKGKPFAIISDFEMLLDLINKS